MTDTTDQPVNPDTSPDQQATASDSKPAPARSSSRKTQKGGTSEPPVDVAVDDEAPICRICLPAGWPDGATAVGCEHGNWTR